jgi:hypothetical protein
MEFRSLCEVISAAHLSRYVEGPINDRGGLILVAPPGHMKTTAAEILREYTGVTIVSNVTVTSLTAMKDDFLAASTTTLVFSDIANIYRRHGSVSSNIEGVIMGLAGEGFRKPAFSDQRIQAVPARCLIIGCATPKFVEGKEGEWQDSGFYRRFIWARYLLSNPEVLEEALKRWKRYEIEEMFRIKAVNGRPILYSLSDSEQDIVYHSLRFMKDRKTSIVLAQKILSVMKWKFRQGTRASDIWSDFAESLTPDGAKVSL